MLYIRLPEILEARLNALAVVSGRTRTMLALEAVTLHIDDLEDFYLAQSRARKNAKSIPLDDVKRQLGLDC